MSKITKIKCESDCLYSTKGVCSLVNITLRQEKLTDSQVKDNEFFCRNYIRDPFHKYDLIWNNEDKKYEYIVFDKL